MAEKLAGVELKMTAKVGTGNKLFGAITNQNVADELSKSGVTLEKKFIQIVGGSIKALGRYSAAVRLHREVVVNFEFEVICLCFWDHLFISIFEVKMYSYELKIRVYRIESFSR